MSGDSGKLTAVKIKAAKPGKHFDGGGLFLHVFPNGARYWRLKYRYNGKEKLLALGVFPEVSLSEARRSREQARSTLRHGLDPSTHRHEQRAQAAVAASNTFESVALEWLQRRDVADVTAAKTRWLLNSFLLPEIGPRPIHEVTPRELLTALRKVEATGKLESAVRAKVVAGQVFRFAIIEGKADTDPTQSLRGALRRPDVRHRAGLTDPKAIGGLLRAIDGFQGHASTVYALRLAPLVFVRPGELRGARWNEIDFDAAMWRIPGERMKMKAPHLVPLSRQALVVLRELQPFTGSSDYLFPSVRSWQRPISDNTVNATLRRLGYSSDEMTGHGFRSMAATRLNEMGWRADAIERQLAHAESNRVRDAYTSAAQYLDERKKMMQAWADYLDALKTGAKILPIKKSGTRR